MLGHLLMRTLSALEILSNQQVLMVVQRWFAYNITRNYRNSYKLHAVNGILLIMNPRRGSNSSTKCQICIIKKGKSKNLNLEYGFFRDWGIQGLCEGMHMIINHSFRMICCSPGNTFSSQMTDYVFHNLDLLIKNLLFQSNLLRPEDCHYLRGDSSKLRILLNWVLIRF